MDAPAAPPHVFSGVSSILTKPPPNDSYSITELFAQTHGERQMRALIISVYLLVAMLLRGQYIHNDERIQETEQALHIMNDMDSPGVEEDPPDFEDVDNWLAKLHSGGWLDLDWHRNIPRGSGLQIYNNQVDAVQQLDAGAERVEVEQPLIRAYYMQDFKASCTTLQPGLGTMVCRLLLAWASVDKIRCKEL